MTIIACHLRMSPPSAECDKYADKAAWCTMLVHTCEEIMGAFCLHLFPHVWWARTQIYTPSWSSMADVAIAQGNIGGLVSPD